MLISHAKQCAVTSTVNLLGQLCIGDRTLPRKNSARDDELPDFFKKS